MWPGSELCAEYPVSARLDNGQRVAGRIDLLISTADGLVVMDLKLAGNSDGKVRGFAPRRPPHPHAAMQGSDCCDPMESCAEIAIEWGQSNPPG